MIIKNWIIMNGCIDKIAYTENARINLIATHQLNIAGVGVKFPCEINGLCEIFTKDSIIFKVNKNIKDNLFYVNIFKLHNSYVNHLNLQCNYNYNKCCYGDAGIYNLNDLNFSILNCLFVNNSNTKELIKAPDSKRKQKPTHDIIFRVWNLHQRLYHASLERIASDLRSGLLLDANVTVQEVESVMQHQQCISCALAKWNKSPNSVGSGIRMNIRGNSWSLDYKGPYKIKAIGGYTGKVTIVELSVGFGIVFLVHSKTEVIECTI